MFVIRNFTADLFFFLQNTAFVIRFICHLVINGARLSDHCIKMQNHAYLKCKVNKTFDLSPIFSVGFKLSFLQLNGIYLQLG